MRGADGVVHLANRVRTLDRISDLPRGARTTACARRPAGILVDAAIAAGAAVSVQPSVTFVYPTDRPVSEETPIGEVLPILRSALAAEDRRRASPSTTSAETGSRSRPSASPGPPGWRPQASSALFPPRRVPPMVASQTAELQERCQLLRSLHRPGAPLLLPNAWDAATARAVVSAGFPVVATSSGAVAAALGYEDHEGAPAEEMLAAAARIVRSVDVPVSVDAEAGYGLEPSELVAALQRVGAAGCNLEDTDHAAGALRDAERHAAWLGAVRQAASAAGYPLVINARVDVFLAPFFAGAGPGTQDALLDEALRRAHAYLEAGADCVYPITLCEPGPLRRFLSEVRGPVNVARLPQAPPLAELAVLGVARVSWATLLYRTAMARFEEQLGTLTQS
jgi:2-methylisocitrate lyase-like PEP mutase family enzyme